MSVPKIHEIFSLDKKTNTILPPQILLTTKSFKIIGLVKYTNWNFSLVGAGIDEITFDVYKPAEIKENMDWREKLNLEYEKLVWDNLVDLKTIMIQDYGCFEIAVSYTDNTKTVKSIHATSLECELSQLYLNDFHVNDEEAMSNMEITEYNKDNFDENGNFIPTTLCNFSDEKHSLLHRVIADKAPHWKIGNQELGTGFVTPYIALDEGSDPELTKRFQRTFSCNGESIYDFLTNTVATECNVVFLFDTLNRTINCYSLCDCINQSTGEIVASAIGADTNIFISKEKLTNEISISSNKDNVKNCFKVSGGDEIITSLIPVVNVNGSNYIMTFSDAQYNDMSDELVSLLKEYQLLLKESSSEYEDLYLQLCDAYDQKYYLEFEMMPAVTLEDKTAQQEYESMIASVTASDFYVAVQTNYTNTAYAGVTNNIAAIAQVLVNSKFEVEIIGDTSYSLSSETEYAGIWTGKFRIKNKYDVTDFYPVTEEAAEQVSIYIYKDELKFAEQKLEKALNNIDMLNIKFDLENSKYIHSDGTINETTVTDYFNQYCLNQLNTFYNGYETCVSILAEMGKNEDGSNEKIFYDRYLSIRNIVKKLQTIRQKEVDEVTSLITALNQERISFQESLNMENFLGDYYLEFCTYRREDNYTNNNYISDGLDDAACLEKAKELLTVAQKEINKACVLQRTLSSDLNNLFMLKEFEPLYNKFSLFNYIRVQTNDEILKLRLIGIEISGSSLSSINVTFSDQIESVDGKINDIKSILEQANSMSSTFPATTRQAKKGQEAKEEVVDFYKKGLNAAKILLTNSNNNEVTYGGFGLLCKNQGDSGDYGNRQLRIIGDGMYLTDDAWEHVKMAVGRIVHNGEEKYGIIADTIIGKLLLGENLGIYNTSGSLTFDQNGFMVKNDTTSVTINPNDTSIFTIVSNDGRILHIDSNGRLSITGDIVAKSLLLTDDATIAASNVSGLSKVATTGSYSDLSNKPSIPTSVEDLGFETSNIIYKGDITQTTKTDSNGVSYVETSVPTSNGTIKYSTYNAEDYIVFGRSKGTNSSGKDYVSIGKTGLLTARNAIIYGTIYATDGEFTGTITAENGAIGGWTIDSNVLYAINDNTYTILRRNGNVAIAVGAPSLSSTTGANVRIFHNGAFNLGYNGNGTGDVSDYNFYVTASGNVSVKGTINASTIKSSVIQGAFDSSGSPKFSIDANGNITGASLSSSTGGNFNIDDQGLITGANLSIENEISTEVINCTTINNKAYPKTLASNATIYVNATSGDDDNECITDAVFQTLQGAINSIPKFMNGRTVTIELQTNTTENILISSHVSGRISINLNGKTIYGYIRSNAHAYTTIDGDGTIHPSTGVSVGSYTASVYVERGAVCQISKVKIYPADNLATDTSYKACIVSNQSQIYASSITIVNSPYVGFMANIMGRIHVTSSSGLASNYGHMAASGGYISLGNSKQTGGNSSNTTESGGGTVKYHSATFDTVTSSSSSTASTTKVTKTATYTSSKGNAIQNYDESSPKWRSDNTPKVGDWGYGNHAAFWFFGDDFESMANKDVTKIEITFTRTSGGNSSAVSHRFYAHSYESQPKTLTPTYYTTAIGSVSVATNSTGTVTITNSSLINNIKARKGICSIPEKQDKAHYSVMSGTMRVKFYYTE